MSTRKGIKIIKLDESKIQELLSNFASLYSCDDFSDIINQNLFYTLEGKFKQVYMFRKNNFLEELLLKLNDLDFFPYSIGTPILKEYNNSYFKPTLTFGSLVKDKCNNKITIDRNKAELITFKKSVIINNLFSFNNAIVLDDRKDFVAFAILKPIKLNKIGNATEVIPTLDIGWYLREGG